MKPRQYPLLICLAGILGCSPANTLKRKAEEAVRHDLRDPDSAQFRYDTVEMVYPDTGIVCGEVNSRNAFGAYAGFERFAYSTRLGVGMESQDSGPFDEIFQQCLGEMGAETRRIRASLGNGT